MIDRTRKVASQFDEIAPANGAPAAEQRALLYDLLGRQRGARGCSSAR